jgi:hypothetical protein
MSDDATKRCAKCREEKLLSEFGRDASRKDGLNPWCRACKSAAHTRYYQENREARAAWHRTHYQENRDAIRAQQRAARDADPEKVREQDRKKSRRWREAHTDEANESTRQWREATRATVFGHYGTVCACCGTTENLSIDHVNGGGKLHHLELFGRTAGGAEFWSWLIKEGFPPDFQTLCLRCNQSKGPRDRCGLDHTA